MALSPASVDLLAIRREVRAAAFGEVIWGEPLAMRSRAVSVAATTYPLDGSVRTTMAARVRLVEAVAVDAVRLTRLAALSPTRVLERRDGLEVLRVDAVAYEAEVVDLVAFRDRADEDLVRDSVDEALLAVVEYAAVALLVEVAGEEHAAGLGAHGARKQTTDRRTGARRHQDCSAFHAS